jgi:opacity protein-like surface antigen
MRLSKVVALASLLISVSRPAYSEQTDVVAPRSPPPGNVEYFEYGVALTAETVVDPAQICRASSTPCILGSGGGLTLRAGYRSRGPWYLGGAYEVTRHDSSNLIRLAILQQLRAEARHYWELGTRTTPFLGVGVGGMLYGNEWGAETGGLVGSLGLGLVFQLSESVLVGATLAYRPLLLRRWTDGAGELRADTSTGFGLAHMAGLELTLEVRDPLPRF